jgi:hypothetical protein
MSGRITAACLALAIPAMAWGLPSPGRERLLVSGAGDQTEPRIAGPYVPFTDQAAGPGGWKIGVFNYGGGPPQTVPGATGPRHQPAISGQILAFTEVAAGYGQIWIYDLIGGALRRISPTAADQGRPAVGQDAVFWEDAREGRSDIWFLNLVTGESRALPEQGVKPRASGKRVVYLEPGARPAVKLCDVSAPTPVPVLIHPGPAESADIQGNNVAVSVDVGPGPPNPPSYDVLVYTVAGQPAARLSLPGDQVNPHISGHWVAFEDLSLSSPAGKSSRVILWDYTASPRVLIAPPAGRSLQILSDLDYPRAVYADDRGGDLDVYGYDPTDTGGTPPPDGGPPDGGPPDGGPPDGGCHRQCDDDDEDCEDDDHHHGRGGGHHDDGDHHRHGHGDGEPGSRHRGGGHGHHGGHDDCDDDHPHRRDGGAGECDEGEILADLTVDGRTGDPAAGSARFEVGAPERVTVCIDAERVSSAWVTLNDRVVAGPDSFDPHVVRLLHRATVPEGASRIGATIAGRPGGSLRVRVLRGAAEPAAHRWTQEAPPRAAAPAGQGCGTGAGGGVALGALLAAVGRRRRRAR